MKRIFIIETQGRDLAEIFAALMACADVVDRDSAVAGRGENGKGGKFAFSSVDPELRPDLTSLVGLTVLTDQLMACLAESLTKTEELKVTHEKEGRVSPPPPERDDPASQKATTDLITRIKAGLK